jgi:hypothetical protein
MPTNNEIAEWLREAAEKHMLTNGDDRWAETLLIRANIVESMSCETCAKWNTFPHRTKDGKEWRTCRDGKSPIFLASVPNDFYCCHREGKDERERKHGR